MAADLSGPIDRGEVCVALGPDGATLGFVLCRAERQDMLLDTLAVWPAHKGQGVGTALVAHVEALARAQGLHAVMLCTNAAMTENQRFYPALGYLRTGRAMQDGFDRVFYRKVLD
jgi:ribosomal protein S18 acetylase RimI-like enzyme